MGFRDTIDRLRSARVSRHYRPSDRTKRDLEESEEKYQKWKNSKKSFKRRNERTPLDTALGFLDSMGGVSQSSTRRGSTSIEKEAKRRASKRIRYEQQELRRLRKEEEKKKEFGFGGIVYGSTKNTEYATRMFGGKKKRRPVNQSWSNEDFFSNMWKI